MSLWVIFGMKCALIWFLFATDLENIGWKKSFCWLMRCCSFDDYFPLTTIIGSIQSRRWRLTPSLGICELPTYLSTCPHRSCPLAIGEVLIHERFLPCLFIFSLTYLIPLFSSCAGAVVVYVVISFWIHRNQCHWDWPPGTLGLCGIWSPRTVIWWIHPFFLSFSYFVVNHWWEGPTWEGGRGSIGLWNEGGWGFMTDVGVTGQREQWVGGGWIARGDVWWLAVYAVSASVEKLLSSHLMVRSTGKKQLKKQFSNNWIR